MTKKILIVDDDDLVRLTLDRVLSNSGYTVRAAPSAKEALEILGRENDIKVFILDLMMPVMNGVELCIEIRKRIGVECVVYALTGHVENYHIEECRQAGFDDYFAKPFKVAVILKMVELAFEKVQRWQELDDKAGKKA